MALTKQQFKITQQTDSILKLETSRMSRFFFFFVFIILLIATQLNFDIKSDLQGNQLPGTLIIFGLLIISCIKTCYVRSIFIDTHRNTIQFHTSFLFLNTSNYIPFWFGNPSNPCTIDLKDIQSVHIDHIPLISEDHIEKKGLLKMFQHTKALYKLSVLYKDKKLFMDESMDIHQLTDMGKKIALFLSIPFCSENDRFNKS